jgi:hypothetical protein
MWLMWRHVRKVRDSHQLLTLARDPSSTMSSSPPRYMPMHMSGALYDNHAPLYPPCAAPVN